MANNVEIQECSVCKESLADQTIFQCSEGHLVCGVCDPTRSLPSCPVCRTDMRNKWTRNRELEHIYEGRGATQTEPNTAANNPLPAGEPFMTIYVKTMTGKTMNFVVSRDELVEDFMTMIQARDGTPVAEQRLLFNGLQLEQGRTLASYRVLDRSILQLVVRQIGGPRISGPEAVAMATLLKQTGRSF